MRQLTLSPIERERAIFMELLSSSKVWCRLHWRTSTSLTIVCRCFLFFLFFLFKRQEEYLKFIFMQNEDQRIVGSTCWYKDALGSSSFKRKISLPGPTCELQGCSLGLVQGIQRLEQLIWLILFAVAGATGLNSLACFKSPGKTISDYLILHLLICDVSVFPKMLMEMSWNRLYQHNVSQRLIFWPFSVHNTSTQSLKFIFSNFSLKQEWRQYGLAARRMGCSMWGTCRNSSKS